MSLHNVNLNLIPVLRELLHRRSIADAGLALGRSSSAVSQSLKQLRAMLNDPLLVRTGSRMILTPRAVSLVDAVNDAYGQMEKLLQLDTFDPAQADRLFIIASTDYHVHVYGRAIVSAIQSVAPGITVRFLELGPHLLDQVATRSVDFALLPQFILAELGSDRMLHRKVASSVTVALMCEDHPLTALAKVDQKDLTAYSHIAFHPSWEALGRRSAIMVNRQLFNVVAYTAHITMLPTFLSGTEFVALVPKEVAGSIGRQLGLVYRPLGFAEEPVISALAWSAIQDADIAHRWFRKTVCDAIIAMG